MNEEFKFYEKRKNWDFSTINYIKEELTNWNMYEILKEVTNSTSKILDLGTGGGERVIKYFPEVSEILGTDFSPSMINTAYENLKK